MSNSPPLIRYVVPAAPDPASVAVTLILPETIAAEVFGAVVSIVIAALTGALERPLVSIATTVTVCRPAVLKRTW